MTPEELTNYKFRANTRQRDPVIWASSYSHGGTLLYGYTSDKESFHVYVENGKIVRVIYKGIPGISAIVVKDIIMDTGIRVSSLIPDKRAYPERTLTTFAMNILDLGYTIPFTTISDKVRPMEPGEFVAHVA